jgi:hypothetical protein
MRLTPVSSPAAIPPQGTPEHVRTAKAIAAFEQGKSSYDKPQSNAQEHPVQNPSQVAVEELGAIQPRQEESVTSSNNEPQEVQPAQPAETEKKDPALSRQFAQLARQEKILRQQKQQQEQAFKEREAALKAREAELSKPQRPAEGYVSIEDIKRNPLGMLTNAGVTYDELTSQILNTGTLDPRVEATISKLEAKIKSLEEASETTQKTYQEQQVEARKAAVRQISRDAMEIVRGNPDEFEAISKIGSRGIQEAVRLIEETFDKDQYLMSTEDALREIENYLVEENFNMSTNVKKIKNRILQSSAQNANTQPKTPVQPQQTQPGMKTLTNAASGSRKLSTRERAILAFKNELKS